MKGPRECFPATELMIWLPKCECSNPQEYTNCLFFMYCVCEALGKYSAYLVTVAVI